MANTGPMTTRERWMAAIRMAPVDRLPFWPKLNASYAAAQEAPFCDMSIDALHAWIGSDPHGGGGSVTREVRTNTAFETVEHNGSTETRYVTPRGTLTAEFRRDEASRSSHPVKFPVQSKDDIEVLKVWLEDCDFEVDTAGRAAAQEQRRRNDGRTCTSHGIGTTPIMQWLQHYAGIEQGHFFLLDHPTEVEALFEAHHRCTMRRTRTLAEVGIADTVWLTENTSTTLISPDHYRRYCYPLVCEYGATLRQGGGAPMIIHMCGFLKDLLPQLATVPAEAFEAFTSPPVGNTRFTDGRAGCPDKCLIGGTNAALWIRPAAEIIAELARDLDALPHHRGIMVTSAGVMPPAASPQTIKAVCDFVHAYPARM